MSSSTRTLTGAVTSAGRDKTITVTVERQTQHPKYKKYIKRTTKLHAHDAANVCKVGDKVLVSECRPISKSKTWQLVEVIESVE